MADIHHLSMIGYQAWLNEQFNMPQTLQDAIGSGTGGGPDVFSSYATEMGLAATPDQLLDRINLLLMAGEMDSTLRDQILAAVNAIAIPAGDQNAINVAFAARLQTAIYLTMASPSFCAQF